MNRTPPDVPPHSLQIDHTDRGWIFERFAAKVTCWTGTTQAFVCALAAILLWVGIGPHFHYSDTWQLVINTSTTIITFLMVFLIQRSQNRETLALKIQMAELIASVREAQNEVIDLDDVSEQQLVALHRRYQELSHTSIAAAEPTTIKPVGCASGPDPANLPE